MEANHRAQDVVCLTGKSCQVGAKFAYGPFDVAALTGEKVELAVRLDAGDSKWEEVDIKDTDNSGKVTFTIPKGIFVF